MKTPTPYERGFYDGSRGLSATYYPPQTGNPADDYQRGFREGGCERDKLNNRPINPALKITDTAATADKWEPQFSPWRHGGWYVDNLRYPSGAVGCVSRNYPDKKWRIVCDPRPFEERPTFPNRIAAAHGERALIAAVTSGAEIASRL